MRTCDMPGCEKRHFGLGLCAMHYTRKRSNGDPSVVMVIRGDDVARFWSKVEKREGCWVWHGGFDTSGYGHLPVRGTTRKAHRMAYELVVGPIPEGLELDHLCRNRGCCNPAHLEPVTHRVNGLRGTSPISMNALKTHCPRGHAYDLVNTRLYRGFRYCRACDNTKKQRRRQQMEARSA